VIAGFGLVLLLMWLGTLWLLDRGARGAEIANVLALPMTVVGTLLTVLGTLAALGLLVPQRQPRSAPPQAAEQPGQPAGRRWTKTVGRIRSYVRTRAGIGLLLVLSLAATIPFWATPLAARAQVLVAGCKHATELRILTSPEQLEPTRLLADRFRQSARRYGCELFHPYVFALPTRQAREMIAARWPDSALRDAGPRPDVWLAESAREVDLARNVPGGAAAGSIVADVAFAWSPIVFGLPRSIGSGQNGELRGRLWSDLLIDRTRNTDSTRNVVRPDPTSSPTGEMATALLYGSDTVGPELARSIERRVDRSLDDGRYPLGDSLDVLCRYRELNPPDTAVVVSEQALARFNNGDPLGDGCGTPVGQRGSDHLLRAYYPLDTGNLEHRLVRFGWSAPAQAAAAATFGTWLAGEDGARALTDVGLRPPVLTAGGLLTERNGLQPDAILNRDPLPASVFDVAMKTYRTTQRHSRVLLVMDSSESMSAPAGARQVSRFTVVKEGLINALGQLGEHDEFGLRIFPAGSAGGLAGSETRELVAIGPRDGLVNSQPRRDATDTALSGIRPAGNTPLHQAIVDGVTATALGPSNDETYSKALVVLTDGRDNANELAAAQVVDAVRGKGVRVFMVAVGEASCATAVMRDVAAVAGGRCLDADFPSIDATLVELFTTLRGGG
jgi:Ca-activated chloride channel homolog